MGGGVGEETDFRQRGDAARAGETGRGGAKGESEIPENRIPLGDDHRLVGRGPGRLSTERRGQVGGVEPQTCKTEQQQQQQQQQQHGADMKTPILTNRQTLTKATP